MITSITLSDKRYPYTESLLTEAFPENERRDIPLQREMIRHNKKFFWNVVLFQDIPAGLLAFWNLGSFIYIEHFAIDPAKRNHGIGEQTMKEFIRKNKGPFVLEIEIPDTEISRRRMLFYERMGFRLADCPYEQPPYRKTDKSVPMRLMTYGKLFQRNDFPEIISAIYKNVYLKEE